MEEDNTFGVPAGWYPDPLGLPQLRWWDAQAWTEHTSEARAPMVVQPVAAEAQPSYVDEELPSRREQRERERRDGRTLQAEHDLDFDTEVDFDTETEEELSAQPLLAMTLRELEPPLEETAADHTPGPRRATAHANTAPAASAFSALAEQLDEAPVRTVRRLRSYTVAVWIIAAMPFLQLAAGMALIITGYGNNLPLMLVTFFGPYFLVLGFAAYDRLLLQTWGHSKPASAWWALLTAPAYLIARAIATFRQTGRGFATLGGFAASFLTVFVGILILPGLLIALLPATFSAEVERSVAADARILGAEIALDCPATPPLRVGDEFTCIATRTSDGESDSIRVSLQRENGWVAWQVEDWGFWALFQR